MCSLVCNFQLVYTMASRVQEKTHFSIRYLPNSKQAYPKPTQSIPLSINKRFTEMSCLERFWSEHLLAEVIFRSAMQHDCQAATDALKGIATKNAAVFRSLEDLLFYRLRKDGEWQVRNDLSSIFEQLQLSESLGARTNERLEEIVRWTNPKKGRSICETRLMEVNKQNRCRGGQAV